MPRPSNRHHKLGHCLQLSRHAETLIAQSSHCETDPGLPAQGAGRWYRGTSPCREASCGSRQSLSPSPSPGPQAVYLGMLESDDHLPAAGVGPYNQDPGATWATRMWGFSVRVGRRASAARPTARPARAPAGPFGPCLPGQSGRRACSRIRPPPPPAPDRFVQPPPP